MKQRPPTDHPRMRRSPGAGRSATLLALVVAVLAIGASPAAAAVNCSPSSGWGTNRPDLAGQIVTLVNQYRVSRGLPALAVSPSLTASSTWKSLHMAGYGYFGHNDPAPPVSRSAFQRARDCDYGGSTWGENIAWGYASAQAAFTGWINSPGHRANIESPSYASTGVGVAANASGTLLWTQNFGNDGGGAPPPPPPPPPPAPVAAPAPAPVTTPLPAPAPVPAAAAAPVPRAAPGAPPATPATPVAGSPSPLTASPTTPAAAPNPAGATQGPSPASTADASAPLPVGARPARLSRASHNTRLLASVAFVQLATGKPLANAQVRCRAEVGGRRLRVLANVFRARSARCAWSIPRWARGKQLVGVVAVQIGQKAAIRLFKTRVT